MSDEAHSDVELVEAAARGDSAAFGTLVRRHIRASTLFAAQLMGDQDEAEDVVQDAFTVVYRQARTFDRTRPFAPWLYGIVRRIAHDRRRRVARRRRLLDDWWIRNPSDVAQSEVDVDETIVLDRVASRVRSLPQMQRACFELVAVHGITPAEVASLHGISESTVRQHVFRARRRLRSELAGDCVYRGDTTEDDDA